MVEYWRSRRGGNLEKAVDIADHLAVDLSGQRLHKVYVELLADTLQHVKSPEEEIRIRLEIASSLKMDGQLTEALDQCEKALKISMEIGDRAGEGTMLNNISQIYDAQGDYETALTYLKQSLAISRQIGDKAGEGRTLNNISQIYRRAGGLRDGADPPGTVAGDKPANRGQVRRRRNPKQQRVKCIARGGITRRR